MSWDTSAPNSAKWDNVVPDCDNFVPNGTCGVKLGHPLRRYFEQKWDVVGAAYALGARRDGVKGRGGGSLPRVNLANWQTVPIVKAAVSQVDVAGLR